MKITGLGRKRPQVNIPLSLIDLDNLNPRLPDELQNGSQSDIMQVLLRKFDLEELAFSMAENGYFDEEPIVVVLKRVSRKVNLGPLKSVEQIEKKLDELIAAKQILFTVVEGNRRTATAKILTQDDWREKFNLSADFPKPHNKAIVDDLAMIPAIFYTDRHEVSPYLGVRHIAGIMKWDAFAKARYIAGRIEEEAKHRRKNIDAGVREVQRQIGDRSDAIKRQYLYYKILDQAREETSFDIKPAMARFSLITVALNHPSIRDFIGVSSYKEVDVGKALVPRKKLQNLEILLTWIYGNGKDKAPILTDSRKISSHLAPILADKEATDHLLKYGNLEEAYERGGGEKIFLKKKINDAMRNISHALGVAFKYKEDKEIKALIEDCAKIVGELSKMIS